MQRRMRQPIYLLIVRSKRLDEFHHAHSKRRIEFIQFLHNLSACHIRMGQFEWHHCKGQTVREGLLCCHWIEIDVELGCGGDVAGADGSAHYGDLGEFLFQLRVGG